MNVIKNELKDFELRTYNKSTNYNVLGKARLIHLTIYHYLPKGFVLIVGQARASNTRVWV